MWRRSRGWPRGSPAVGAGERLAGAVLIVLMAVGSLALWLLVPAAPSLWLASKLVGSSAEEFLVGLPITVVAMVRFGAFLGWLNRLYLRVTGVLARYEAEEEEFGVAPRFLHGPLEPFSSGRWSSLWWRWRFGSCCSPGIRRWCRCERRSGDRAAEVVKRFGREPVLDEVDLAVPTGAITVLLGPSGAGKTVTIKHMLGLIRPDRGFVASRDRTSRG